VKPKTGFKPVFKNWKPVCPKYRYWHS